MTINGLNSLISTTTFQRHRAEEHSVGLAGVPKGSGGYGREAEAVGGGECPTGGRGAYLHAVRAGMRREFFFVFSIG